MKLVISLLILLLSNPTIYSKEYICIAGKKFQIPELGRKIGWDVNYLVKFSVINFVPTDIKIEAIDSNSQSLFNIYNEVNIKNISMITFLRDSIGCELILKYEIKPERELNDDFSELKNINELRLVFKRDYIVTSDPVRKFFSLDADTLTNTSFIFSTKRETKISDIIVERIFKEKMDTSFIRSNNYPEYTDEILRVSSRYSKKSFNDLVIKPGTSKAKWFFIRFHVINHIKECDYIEEL